METDGFSWFFKFHHTMTHGRYQPKILIIYIYILYGGAVGAGGPESSDNFLDSAIWQSQAD